MAAKSKNDKTRWAACWYFSGWPRVISIGLHLDLERVGHGLGRHAELILFGLVLTVWEVIDAPQQRRWICDHCHTEAIETERFCPVCRHRRADVYQRAGEGEI